MRSNILCNTTINRVILILIFIFIFLPTESFPQQELTTIDALQKNIDCLGGKYDHLDGVTWQDVCYSNDYSRSTSRRRLQQVNEALDLYEYENNDAGSRLKQQQQYQRNYDSYITNTDYIEPLERNFVDSTDDFSPQTFDDWSSTKTENSYPASKGGSKSRVDDWMDGETSTLDMDTESGENWPKLWSFLEKLDYGFILETDRKPRYYFEGVFPLKQSYDGRDVVFTHNRLSFNSEKEKGYLYSGGLGYRYLTEKEDLLLGANIFYDFEDPQKHYRLGFGLELASDENIEANFNYYKALSGKKKVDSTADWWSFEKAVDGYDVEVGGGIPSVPWTKLFLGYSQFFYDREEDKKGWKIRTEIKPTDNFIFNIDTFDDNKSDRHYRFDGRFRLAFDTFRPKDMIASLDGLSDSSPEKVNLRDRMLDRVERNFDIEVEKWRETNTGDILPYDVGSGGDMQIQLIWPRGNDNDMDLHMNLPAGDITHVYYLDPISRIGGEIFAQLDVDDIPLNGHSHPGRDHIENIYIATGMIQAGTYQPYVHVYSYSSDVTVRVNVFIGGAHANTYTHTFTADNQTYNLPPITYP